MVQVSTIRDISVSYISGEYKLGDGVAIRLSSSGVFIWIGSLRSDDSDGDENVHLSVHDTFSVHFFTVTARLRCENA